MQTIKNLYQQVLAGYIEPRKSCISNFYTKARNYFVKFDLFHFIFVVLWVFIYADVRQKSFTFPGVWINGMGEVDPIFVEYSKRTNNYPKELKHIIQNQRLVLDRAYNDFISWSENVKSRITEGFQFNADRLNKDALIIRYQIYSVEDVVVNQGSTFAYKNKFIIMRQHFSSMWFVFNNGTIQFTVDEALITGHNYCRNNFGHVIHDYMLPLMLFPESYLKKLYVITTCNYKIAHEMFDAVGVPQNKIIWLPVNAWVTCKKLYTVDKPSPLLRHFGTTSKRFQERAASYWGLDEIMPTKYVLCNRKPGYRYIGNFMDIYKACQNKLPQYPWEILSDYFPTINETAREWAAIKFAFLPAGSNCAKVYFMHPGTALCVGEADRIDYSPMKDAASCSVFSRWFKFEGMTHYGNLTDGWIVDVEYSIENIKVALYAVKYQKWPVIDDYHLYI